MIISLLSATLLLQTIDVRPSHACLSNIERLRPLALESYSILLQSMSLFELEQLLNAPLKRPQTKDLKAFSGTIPVFDAITGLILRESRENLDSETLTFNLRELVRLEILRRNETSMKHQIAIESNQAAASDIVVQADSSFLIHPTLLVSPDGSKIYSQISGLAFAAWDTRTGDFAENIDGNPLVFTADRELPTTLIQSTDGKTIFSGTSKDSVRLWDAETGLPLKTSHGSPRILQAPMNCGGISAMAIHPTEKILYAGNNNGQLIIWDLETDHPIVSNTHSSQIVSLAVDPEVATIHAKCADTTVLHFNAKTGAEIPDFKYTSLRQRIAVLQKIHGGGRAFAMPLNFKIQYSYSISNDDLDIILKLSGAGGNPVVDDFNQPIVLRWHKSKIVAFTLSPDGQYLYSRDESGAIHFWSLREYLPPKYFEATP